MSTRPSEPAFYSKPAYVVRPARSWLRKLGYRDLKQLREIREGKYAGNWCDDPDWKNLCEGVGKLPSLVAEIRGPGGGPALTTYGEIVLELDRERMIDQVWDLLPPNRREIDASDRRYYITARNAKWPIDEMSDQDLESTILERGGERPGYERTRNPAVNLKRLLNPWGAP